MACVLLGCERRSASKAECRYYVLILIIKDVVVVFTATSFLIAREGDERKGRRFMK